MKIPILLSFVAAPILCGCASKTYRYREPLAELHRPQATTESVIKVFGQPAKISRSSGVSKEGPPMDLAFRYYFATRDEYPAAKSFYFYKGKWTGESVLGGVRKEDVFRLLDPLKESDRKLIVEWDTSHPFTW